MKINDSWLHTFTLFLCFSIITYCCWCCGHLLVIPLTIPHFRCTEVSSHYHGIYTFKISYFKSTHVPHALLEVVHMRSCIPHSLYVSLSYSSVSICGVISSLLVILLPITILVGACPSSYCISSSSFPPQNNINHQHYRLINIFQLSSSSIHLVQPHLSPSPCQRHHLKTPLTFIISQTSLHRHEHPH